jgi:hypothetical protein
MLNWQYELKKYIAKKFHEKMGFEIGVENIHTVEMNLDLDLPELSINDLAHIYAFGIMKEDFEQAEKIANELKRRKCVINIDTDNSKNVGVISITKKSKKNPISINIPLKVYPDGVMIDFEKEGF